MKKLMVMMLTVLVAFGFVFSTAAFAEKEIMPVRHLLVLGDNTPVSNTELTTSNPVFVYLYTNESKDSDKFFQSYFGFDQLFVTMAFKNEQIFAGIKPTVGLYFYGGMFTYVDGVQNGHVNYKGFATGNEFFFQFSPISMISAKVSYMPTFHSYTTYNSGNRDAWYGRSEETRISNLPNDHIEHRESIEIKLGKVTDKDLGRIKNGVLLTTRLDYVRRDGFGTYVMSPKSNAELFYAPGYDENNMIKPDDIKTTKRVIYTLGAYYDLDGINFLLDITGAYAKNVDRNNAEMIGGFAAPFEHQKMPGYFQGEFIHSRFTIGKAHVGVPIPFWGTRIKAGYNMLYMPKSTLVVGALVDKYPRTTYSSADIEISTKLGDVLPFFFNYAYGIDAKRYNMGNGTLEKGNHEFLWYVVTAFGENK